MGNCSGKGVKQEDNSNLPEDLPHPPCQGKLVKGRSGRWSKRWSKRWSFKSDKKSQKQEENNKSTSTEDPFPPLPPAFDQEDPPTVQPTDDLPPPAPVDEYNLSVQPTDDFEPVPVPAADEEKLSVQTTDDFEPVPVPAAEEDKLSVQATDDFTPSPVVDGTSGKNPQIALVNINTFHLPFRPHQLN